MSNGNQADRLPQKNECRENSEGDFLESASAFAYRVLKEIETLAGTTACKSVQLVRLKQWAQEIHDEFIRLGFHSEDDGGYYTNNQHDIFDAVDGNVLVDDDGHLYFIDTTVP